MEENISNLEGKPQEQEASGESDPGDKLRMVQNVPRTQKLLATANSELNELMALSMGLD